MWAPRREAVSSRKHFNSAACNDDPTDGRVPESPRESDQEETTSDLSLLRDFTTLEMRPVESTRSPSQTVALAKYRGSRSGYTVGYVLEFQTGAHSGYPAPLWNRSLELPEGPRATDETTPPQAKEGGWGSPGALRRALSTAACRSETESTGSVQALCHRLRLVDMIEIGLVNVCPETTISGGGP
eukprot:1467401-Pyramimonas_sp.AAC.1